MIIKKVLRKIAIVLSVIFFILIATTLSLNWYIQSHETEILEKIKIALNENQYGKIQFDTVHFSPYKHFPNISVEVKNFQIIDSLYTTHKKKTIFLKNVRTSVSIIDFIQKKITLNKVTLENGHVNIFVDENGYKNTHVFKNKNAETHKKPSIKLTNSYTKVVLQNIAFTFIEKIKNKRITAQINEIAFHFNPKAHKIIPKATIDVQMKEMGLNLANGTFFNNAHCKTIIKPDINLKEKTITIPEFALHIDKQKLINKAFINYGEDKFRFDINIPKTAFLPAVHLLSQNIQKKLLDFNFKNKLDVTGIIEGKFQYKSIPTITIFAKTKNNEIHYAKENIILKNTAINGTFKNHLYEDKRALTEGPKDFVLHFNTFTSNYKNISLSLNNTKIFGDEIHKLNLDGNINMQGNTKDLSTLINSKNFNFTKGTFKIATKTTGEIKSIADLFSKSTGKLELQNTVVALTKNKTVFNIPKLELYLDKHKTQIKTLKVKLNNQETISCTGEIINFNSLFHSKPKKGIETKLNIQTNKLNFNSLLLAFSSQKNTKQAQNISEIKNSLHVLCTRFNPTISLNVKEFSITNTNLKNLNTTINYTPNALHINPFITTFNNEHVKAVATLGLNSIQNTKGEELTYFDYSIETKGKIKDVNTLLKLENFHFSEANFIISSKYKGNAKNFKDIATNSVTNFTTNKGNVYYKSIGKNFPFKKLDITLKNKDAIITGIDFILPSKKIFTLSGKILDFTEMFSENPDKTCTASIAVTTSNFNFNQFLKWLEETKTETPNKQHKKEHNLKYALKDLYKKYHPEFTLNFDTINYNNIAVNKFSAKLLYNNANNLSLKDLQFLFNDRKGKINANLDISQPKKTICDATLEVVNFNVKKVLKTFSNFSFESLSTPTELNGMIKSTADISVIFDDKNGIENNSIAASFAVELINLRVKEFKPLVNAGNLAFKKSRFQDIKFATIKSNFKIKNNTLIIPRTSVQSSAIDCFIEGYIGKNNTDIWLSIPWSNLKKRNTHKIPEFKDYEDAGKKLYIQIATNKKGKNKSKLHFSNKKLQDLKYDNQDQ